jgi:uncharacterized membrane protein
MLAPTLPMFASVAAWGLAALALAVASWRLPWFKLRGDSQAQHVLFGCLLALVLLRFAVFDRIPGLHLHFLGAGIACLMFGSRFALLGMALASLVASFSAAGVWLGFAPDFLACGALPVLLMAFARRQAEARLPPNPFVYLFVVAFFGAGLAMLGSHLFKAAVVAWLVSDAATDAVSGYLAAAPAMMFGEAFLTGGALAMMVAYRPQWLASFDDERYLR